MVSSPLVKLICLMLSTVNAVNTIPQDVLKTLLPHKVRLDLLEAHTVDTERSKQTFNRPTNCFEVLYNGNTKSGVYTIYPRIWYKVPPLQVYCDMETDGGGWIVIQRRDDYGEQGLNFTREWGQYRDGFGNIFRDFWLGNDLISVLSNQDVVTLRVDLEDFENATRHACYNVFSVFPAAQKYKLTASEYSGDAGDSLAHHHGHVFVTYDRDNRNKCEEKYKGGWWHNNCHHSCLNGKYLRGMQSSAGNGINWQHWRTNSYSLKKTELKIRPKMGNYYKPMPI